MANAYLNMLDIAKMAGADASVGLIEENLNAYPEARIFPARTIPGTSFKSLVRTSYPTVTFRAANEGTETLKSAYANRLHECFYIDGQLEVDNAVATADEMGMAHAFTTEADGVVLGALRTIATQIWYGVGSGGDAKGFPGAVEIVSTGMVVDAGGTTATTGSSVYLVGTGPKIANLLFGRNMVFETCEWRKNTKIASSKSLTVWQNSLEGWVGLEWLNPTNYIVRIKKLTEDSGKGLTDALLADALALFPVGVVPSHIFMSRRSRKQLQKARTVTLFGQGTSRPSQPVIAPTPTEYEGIPIVPTDALLNTEALTL
jgi:hypothetical protein